MKASEVIAKLDAIKPNQYGEKEKLEWLFNIDKSIYANVVCTHETDDNSPSEPESPYTPTTEMIVHEPFSSLYVRYLEMMIDFHNAEYDRYNMDASMYYSDLEEFTAYYNRKYMPLQSNTVGGAKV